MEASEQLLSKTAPLGLKVEFSRSLSQVSMGLYDLEIGRAFSQYIIYGRVYLNAINTCLLVSYVTITWGDVTFDGPYPAIDWDPPYRAAVYAIMMKPDPTNRPTTYRILYFGESGNLSDRGFWRSHHKYQCFIDNAGSESNIYIGIYRMPDSTEEERRAVEQRLIDQYNPVCNR